MTQQLEQCPDCVMHVLADPNDNRATHAYIGASAGCWEMFTYLWHTNEPPLAPLPLNDLILDAYCVQHHGTPSPAAVQSVAVHLLVLYGIFKRDVSPDRAQWIRERAVRPLKIHRHDRWYWLEPPGQGALTIGDIVKPADPTERAHVAQDYVTQVSDLWLSLYESDASAWYDSFIAL